MNFTEYRQEAERLYHEYLKLHQASGGKLPDKLPAMYRPEYKHYDLYIDLTKPEKEILTKIDEFKKNILDERKKQLKLLSQSYPDKAVINKPPTRSDNKATSYQRTIEKAEKALAVYEQRKSSNISIASCIFGFTNTASDSESKSAERKVRQYQAYAKILIKAAGDGSFYEKITMPLPKK